MYYFIEAAAGGSYEPGLDTRPVDVCAAFQSPPEGRARL